MLFMGSTEFPDENEVCLSKLYLKNLFWKKKEITGWLTFLYSFENSLYVCMYVSILRAFNSVYMEQILGATRYGNCKMIWILHFLIYDLHMMGMMALEGHKNTILILLFEIFLVNLTAFVVSRLSSTLITFILGQKSHVCFAVVLIFKLKQRLIVCVCVMVFWPTSLTLFLLVW